MTFSVWFRRLDVKTCLRGVATRYDSNQSVLLQKLVRVLKVWRKQRYRYYTMYEANNNGADQTARMRRVICAFVVCIWRKQVFSWHDSYVLNFLFALLGIAWLFPILVSWVGCEIRMRRFLIIAFLCPATRKWRGIMLYPPKF